MLGELIIINQFESSNETNYKYKSAGNEIVVPFTMRLMVAFLNKFDTSNKME